MFPLRLTPWKAVRRNPPFAKLWSENTRVALRRGGMVMSNSRSLSHRAVVLHQSLSPTIRAASTLLARASHPVSYSSS